MISISILPKEIIKEIFFQIDDPTSLGKMRRVCMTWKMLIDSNPAIWKKFLTKEELNKASDPKSFVIAKFEKKSEADLQQIDDDDHFSKMIFEIVTIFSLLFMASDIIA